MKNEFLTSVNYIKRKSKLMTGVSLGVLVISALAMPAFADDFVVSGVTTTTNDGNTIDGNDTITVTSSGAIGANAGHGISLSGGSNTAIVEQGGQAIATGANSYGIGSDGADDTIIVNGGAAGTSGGINATTNSDDINITINGSIFTNGDGIRTAGQNGTIIVNSGGGVVSASPTGIGINLVTGSDGTSILNNGTIGGTLRGISGNVDSISITNNSAIQASSVSSIGINFTGNNSVINNNESATILGGFLGLYIDGNNNVINNRGSITSGTNGVQLYNGSQGSTLNNSGTIRGDDIGVVISQGDDITINNSSSATIEGLSNHGIEAIDAAGLNINNSGTIRGGGSGRAISLGGNISAADGATIVNNGQLVTDFLTGGAGIYASSTVNGTAVTNNGQIDARFGFQIFGASSVVTNNGAINSYGGNQFEGTGSSFTNNGIITSEFNGFTTSGDNITFVNNGEITSGANNSTLASTRYGVRSAGNDGFTLSNSGKIVSIAPVTPATSNTAISIAGTNSTLNLLAPSYLGGRIFTVAANNPTINITTGASHSVLWTFDAQGAAPATNPTISGPVSGYYNSTTGQFATYDPTALAVAFDQLAETTGMISDVAALKAYSDGPWIAGFGGYGKFDGNTSTLDRTMFNSGFAMGNNFELGNGFEFQAMGGYIGNVTKAKSRWSDSVDNKSNGAFVGVNSAIKTGRYDVGFGVNAGINGHQNRRFVNDNLATNASGQHLGESWASSSYSSFWISPELTVSTDIQGSDGWTFRPTAQVRYAFQSIGGHTETGSDANASVGARNIGVLTAKAELAASKQFGFGKFTGRAGVQSRNNVGGQSANVELIGLTQSVSASADNRFSAYVGGEGQFDLGNERYLGVNSKLTFGGGVTSIAAGAKLGFKF